MPNDTHCETHASVWSATTGRVDIGTLDGIGPYVDSRGTYSSGGSWPEVFGESGAVLGQSQRRVSTNPLRYTTSAFYWNPEVGIVDLGNPSFTDPAAARPFALSATGEILAIRNEPPPEEQAEATSPEPIEIVYWPDAGPGQPDQTIRRSSQNAFAGNRIYNTTGAQQERSSTGRPGSTSAFVVRTHNTGAEPARFSIRGRSSTTGFQVRYFAAGRDVTPQVAAGTYRTPQIQPRGHRDLNVRVTIAPTTPPRRSTDVTIRATNSDHRARNDTVRATVRVARN